MSARNWHLGEPGWSWPDDVDETGTENRSAHRYLPVLNTERYADNVIREWEVARVFVDEDDTEMLDDARIIAAAATLYTACQLLVALEDSATHYADTRWKTARELMRNALASVGEKT